VKMLIEAALAMLQQSPASTNTVMSVRVIVLLPRFFT